jgi:toxin ParE1/3/4
MRFEVNLSEDAYQDLLEIGVYVATHGGTARAEDLLAHIERVRAGLESNPKRGVHVPEMVDVGETDFRELFFKSYRIVYQVTERQVTVLLIADGRRNLRTLLQQRLLRS